jgi:two-component system response regulator AtoC
MSEKKIHLLFVEDEIALREATSERLKEHGYSVVQAESGEEALQKLTNFAFDVIITDLKLPGIDGTQLIEIARERYPDIEGLVVTGYGTVKDAVEAIKKGASDFITKPFQFDHLLHVLSSTLEQRRLKSENAYLRSQLQERYCFEGIVGRSKSMRLLFDTLETVAGTTSTILITGETGTGKELVAKAIHHNSQRKNNRFVALNCSAIPETLLEAEVFGHVRGAFTGAISNRQGRLEQADKGTLFLDEVGTMSVSLQTKLLRVLQEREFERIGDAKLLQIDVRVIAATNSNLIQMVEDGSFREDLYYRLNVIPIHLPPLRERLEDIPLLVQSFLEKIGSKQLPPRTDVVFSQEALRKMMGFSWPGNVRQLENIIERTLALTPGSTQIDVSDLPDEVQQSRSETTPVDIELPPEGIDLRKHLNTIEREIIRRSLDRTNGNKNKAARLLKIKRTTLIEKAKRLKP